MSITKNDMKNSKIPLVENKKMRFRNIRQVFNSDKSSVNEALPRSL